MTAQKNLSVMVISDGTGETAMQMMRAALVQYQSQEFNIIRCKNVRTESQIDRLLDDAKEKQAVVVFTLVSEASRRFLQEEAASKGILALDLLGPIFQLLDRFIGQEQSNRSNEIGILRLVDDQYFRRISAIEFTVKHDDGKDLRHLDEADILLVGISRTSKTPLSIFLSHKGWKVANVPIVLDVAIPDEVFQVDQRKIVGLTIDRDKLSRIRRNRLEKFQQDPGSDYASLNQIHAEIEYASEIFKKNRRWPVFDVTERALEETATEIVKIVSRRMGYTSEVIF